jgi:hypothetical protein
MGLFLSLVMSTFTPTTWTLEPQARPDNLSAAVLHSLSRPIVGHVNCGAISSFIVGTITFGIWPVISWPKRFGRFVVAEQQQLWHFVEWLRIRTGDEEAVRLRDSVRQTGALPTMWIVPIAMLVIVAFVFVPFIQDGGISRAHFVYHANDWMARSLRPEVLTIFSNRWLHVYNIWIACLSIAYVSHWLHVHQHVSDVNAFLRRLNPILARQNLPPMQHYEVGLGVRPLWLLGGFIGLACGAWWAIPAAFAGAVHQRYCKRTSTRIRSELAMRARTILQRQRPPIDVPTPAGFRAFCINDLCGKSVPIAAAYCPRCGTRLPKADAVA